MYHKTDSRRSSYHAAMAKRSTSPFECMRATRPSCPINAHPRRANPTRLLVDLLINQRSRYTRPGKASNYVDVFIYHQSNLKMLFFHVCTLYVYPEKTAIFIFREVSSCRNSARPAEIVPVGMLHRYTATLPPCYTDPEGAADAVETWAIHIRSWWWYIYIYDISSNSSFLLHVSHACLFSS